MHSVSGEIVSTKEKIKVLISQAEDILHITSILNMFA
jgi:hypothetical protein